MISCAAVRTRASEGGQENLSHVCAIGSQLCKVEIKIAKYEFRKNDLQKKRLKC